MSKLVRTRHFRLHNNSRVCLVCSEVRCYCCYSYCCLFIILPELNLNMVSLEVLTTSISIILVVVVILSLASLVIPVTLSCTDRASNGGESLLNHHGSKSLLTCQGICTSVEKRKLKLRAVSDVASHYYHQAICVSSE